MINEEINVSTDPSKELHDSIENYKRLFNSACPYPRAVDPKKLHEILTSLEIAEETREEMVELIKKNRMKPNDVHTLIASRIAVHRLAPDLRKELDNADDESERRDILVRFLGKTREREVRNVFEQTMIELSLMSYRE